VPRVPGQPKHARRLALVDEAFRSLPDRYLGSEHGLAATYRVVLGDIGHVWEVRCTPSAARVHKGATRRKPDVEIATGWDTWMRLRQGEISGVEAFSQGLLSVRGNLDYAISFEGLFRLPGDRPPLLRIEEIVLLLHGLGGTRASLFQTAAALSDRYRVHVPDLPGFGSSSKPAFGAYNAAWFSELMLGLMDQLGTPSARVIGNSMGGRIAIEMALSAPERIEGLVLLCPAVAWVRRGLHAVVRLLRPELGMLPHSFRRSLVASQFWSMFHDRQVLDPAVGELMVDEFRRIYHSAGARCAFLASARNIYLEAPFGDNGFYPRLGTLTQPALFIWGSHDPLVPSAFARHVARWLPNAEQVTLDHCGHVPQVERPTETNELVAEFFDRIEPADHELARAA
jgi:pimeloyl-ACP methyl ester carboxylesterase